MRIEAIVRIGKYASLWCALIIVYAAVIGNSPEARWYMSFANAILNGLAVWLLIVVIIDLRAVQEWARKNKEPIRDLAQAIRSNELKQGEKDG